MNKFTKTLIIVLLIIVSVTGITYGVYKVYKKNNKNYNVTFNPSYESTINENTVNNLWVGTLDLAWKELENQIKKDKIDLRDGNLPIVNDLNNSKFTKDMLNPNSYKIDVSRTVTDGYKIDATLTKNLNFLERFDNFNDEYELTFGGGKEYIKYFGINNVSSEKMNKNIEILFFNNTPIRLEQSSSDFAIKLKTKEGDEIILYRTNDDKSFEEYYNDIQEKATKYEGSKEFGTDDKLLIPYVSINGMIAHNELYGKYIKDTDGLYFTDVVQNVNFNLNESGCNLNSASTMVTEYMSVFDSKCFYFTDKFIIFMKEANADMPYFALKVDNDDILEKREETDEPKIIDYTAIGDTSSYSKYTTGGEYKFYEDENYEYYYPSQKTKVVQVFFKNGDIMTAEDALKQGKITIDLLDKYGVEYIRKQK